MQRQVIERVLGGSQIKIAVAVETLQPLAFLRRVPHV